MIEAFIYGAGTVTDVKVIEREVSFKAGTPHAVPLEITVIENNQLVLHIKTKRLAHEMINSFDKVLVIGEQK